jgi:hypothetical protein
MSRKISVPWSGPFAAYTEVRCSDDWCPSFVAAQGLESVTDIAKKAGWTERNYGWFNRKHGWFCEAHR